jgi:hypothetical protein
LFITKEIEVNTTKYYKSPEITISNHHIRCPVYQHLPGDFSVVETLQQLFASPFDEHSAEARYFQKAEQRGEGPR